MKTDFEFHAELASIKMHRDATLDSLKITTDALRNLQWHPALKDQPIALAYIKETLAKVGIPKE